MSLLEWARGGSGGGERNNQETKSSSSSKMNSRLASWLPSMRTQPKHKANTSSDSAPTVDSRHCSPNVKNRPPVAPPSGNKQQTYSAPNFPQANLRQHSAAYDEHNFHQQQQYFGHQHQAPARNDSTSNNQQHDDAELEAALNNGHLRSARHKQQAEQQQQQQQQQLARVRQQPSEKQQLQMSHNYAPPPQLAAGSAQLRPGFSDNANFPTPANQNSSQSSSNNNNNNNNKPSKEALKVNFNRSSQSAASIGLEPDDEAPGESRKKKYLTAKYGQQQMNLIKKRLKIEMWLYESLQELARGTKSETELDEIDIDLDELLDMESDDVRRHWLKKTLEPYDDLPRDKLEKFIGEVLEQSKLL